MKLSQSIEELIKHNPIDNLVLSKTYVITVAIEDCDYVLEEIY